MAATKIDYLTKVWNPIAMLCTQVSDGCDHCWHRAMAKRHAANPTLPKEVRAARAGGMPWLNEAELLAPLRWRAPQVVGVQYMGDLFHEDVFPVFVSKMFAVMAMCPQHRFLVLTKRPARMRAMVLLLRDRLRAHAGMFEDADNVADALDPVNQAWPLPNVWLGVSAENEDAADERIPLLLQTPAAHRWVSCEPMLGAVTLDHESNADCPTWYDGCNCLRSLNWVVCGGESGPGARPMNPDWVRSLRDQCVAAGVPYYFKQWGEWAPDRTLGLVCQHTKTGFNTIGIEGMCKAVPRGTNGHEWLDGSWSLRVGKKAAGHRLDGKEWRQKPECQTTRL